MILVTPKYPDIHPFAFKEQGPEGQEIPWSHLQILGRQLVAFDKDGSVIGTVDLALTKELKIVRQADIIGYAENGASVTVLSRKTIEQPAAQMQSGDDYDDPLDDEYDDEDYEF